VNGWPPERGVNSTAIHHLNNGRVVSVTHKAMSDGGWVTMHRDITELHTMQTELAHRAYHDPLTGLPNRNLLYQRLGQAFETLQPDGGFAVLCLDLDGFKAINDSMGHASGDKLLRQVANAAAWSMTFGAPWPMASSSSSTSRSSTSGCRRGNRFGQNG